LIDLLLGCEDLELCYQLNRELELLRRFHHQTDFEHLRAERPELTGSRCVDVMLQEDEIGRFNISVRPAELDEQKRKDFL